MEPQHQVWSVQPGGHEILASRYVAKYVLASEDDNYKIQIHVSIRYRYVYIYMYMYVYV